MVKRCRTHTSLSPDKQMKSVTTALLAHAEPFYALSVGWYKGAVNGIALWHLTGRPVAIFQFHTGQLCCTKWSPAWTRTESVYR